MTFRKRTLALGKPHRIRKLVIRRRPSPLDPHLARAQIGQVVIPAAIGRTGASHLKREGDGATPIGVFHLNKAYFRADRIQRVPTLISTEPLRPRLGWSDDPVSHRYNRSVQAGARESHEKLWRQDSVYDVVITTSHNQRPRVLGAGSAIFLHLARPGYEATQGCVAVSHADLRRLLPRLSHRAQLVIVG